MSLINLEQLGTVLNAVVSKIKSSKANWNQNNPNADDYIKNKPNFSAGEGLAIEQKENDIKIKFDEDGVLILDGGGADFSKYKTPVLIDNEDGSQTADVTDCEDPQIFDNNSGQTIIV